VLSANVTNISEGQTIININIQNVELSAVRTHDAKLLANMLALLWPPASYAGRRQFFCFTGCRLDLSFFRRLISDAAWPIVTKLCHMFDGDPDLYKLWCEAQQTPPPAAT